MKHLSLLPLPSHPLSLTFQDEVHRCRQLLLEKEQQLSKMVTSLHVAAAQVHPQPNIRIPLKC